jgi:class 3 adenylate cyclase/predicted ATPase
MVDELKRWLDQLGLSEYAEAFAKNHVNFELLTSLTADDLKDVGVASVGHRRRLLNAITALSANKDTQDPVQYLPDAQTVALQKDRQAERRQLTVMFCDLVGSTALSQKLDPEELSEIIKTYQNTVADQVARYEGHVAKFMGDGVMALFGYPQAHEDDAERAILSALSVVDALSRLEPVGEEKLQVRIGISTGDVVVGDLVGEGAAQEEAVVGDTPNLAARLQDVALSGQVVIDPTTQRLTKRAFTLEKLGSRALKGFQSEIPIWCVSGERQSSKDLESSQSNSLSDFIGRQHELGLLIERWQTAQAGEGQVVLLSGEAGIGKSRLIRALSDAFEHEQLTRLTYQCSPYHTNSSLYPVLRQLERAAEFRADDSDEARYVKLARLFAFDVVPLIASLFSLVPTGHAEIRGLRADERKERTLAALMEQLMTLAREKPVLFLLEDAHWIDSTTLEVLSQTAPNICDHRVLMVLTHRPEWQAPFPKTPHVTQLTLNPLSRTQVEDLVRGLAGSGTDEELIQQIVARTDGVPLFVEELTKSVLEAKETMSEVPESLQASLLARLDRLGPAKGVAQVASAIGRDFSHELLARVIDKPPSELDAAIEQLVASELIFVRGTLPVTRYTFKHALVQDTAYGTLLMKQRRHLHGRIAKALEEISPVTVEIEPETMAHHLMEAGLNQKAVEFWARAAHRAAGQSANVEAIGHFRNALGLILALPESDERRHIELQLQLGLGPALMAVEGWGVREVAEIYKRARTLGEAEGDVPSLFQATWGLWLFNQGRSSHQQARRLTGELIEYARSSRDSTLHLQAHHASWTTMLFTGELASAIKHCEAGIELYDKSVHRDHALQYGGHDPCVCGHIQGAMMYWLSGRPNEAELHNRQGLALAQELSHPTSLVHAHMFSARYRMMRNEPHKALDHANQMIAHGNDMGLQLYTTLGETWRGWALTKSGDLDAGLDQIKELMAARAVGRSRLPAPLDLALFADALAANEEFDAALSELAEALKLVERTGERFWEPEIHRLQGEFLWRQAQSPVRDVEERFRRAIEVSQTLGAKALELRAAYSLARLMHANGNMKNARAVLEPVFSWFAEGHDTPDLENAKALLDKIA